MMMCEFQNCMETLSAQIPIGTDCVKFGAALQQFSAGCWNKRQFKGVEF